MKHLIIILLFLFPITLSAQLLRAYGVVEIGSTFPTSSSTGAKFAYRTTDSSFYRWISGNTWVKVIEPSIIPDTLYLTEEIGTTVKLNGDTINLTPYLLKSDTTSMLVKYIERGDTLGMLSAYIRSAGWGLLKSSYTLSADTSKLATRYYSSTLPTSIASGYIATSNGTNLVARNLFDNDTYVGILNSKPFSLGQWTTAGRPTGVQGYMGYNTTLNGLDWYNGTRWATGLESTFARGTATYIPYFDANGQITESNRFTYTNSLFVQSQSASSGVLLTLQAESGNNRGVRIRADAAGSDNFSFETSLGTLNRFSINFPNLHLKSSSNNIFFHGNDSGDAGSQIFNNSTIFGGSTGTGFGTGRNRPFGLWHGGTDVNTSAFNFVASNSNLSSNTYFARFERAGTRFLSINGNGNVMIGSATDVGRKLFVSGEVRVSDLTTDTPTRIVGADADGDLGELALSNLSISGGSLTAQNIGNSNLTLTGNRTITGGDYNIDWDNISGFNLISGARTGATSITSDVYSSLKQYVNLAKSKYVQKYNSFDSRALTVSSDPNFVDIFEWNTTGSTNYEWGNATILDTTNSIFTYKFGGKYYSAFHHHNALRPNSGTVNRLAPTFDFNVSQVGNASTWSPHTLFRNGTDTLVQIKSDGLVNLKQYDNTTPFTANTLSETPVQGYLTTGEGTGNLMFRAQRQVGYVTDADYVLNDATLKLSHDFFIWAYNSSGRADSLVIDLPTPSSTYAGQVVQVFADCRAAGTNDQIYVRGVGSTLYYRKTGANPTAETYYQMTTISSNSVSARFTCAYNGSYYWVLLKEQ